VKRWARGQSVCVCVSVCVTQPVVAGLI
jgi:hypothetical protein